MRDGSGSVSWRRLRQLEQEQENSRLKKRVAELDLDIEILKEVAARRNDDRVRAPSADRLRISVGGSIGTASATCSTVGNESPLTVR